MKRLRAGLDRSRTQARIPTYLRFHPAERICREVRRYQARRTRGDRTVSNSIARFPRSPSIAIFAGVTRAVECGFLAAGVTVAVLAVVQSVIIVAGWVSAL